MGGAEFQKCQAAAKNHPLPSQDRHELGPQAEQVEDAPVPRLFRGVTDSQSTGGRAG